MTKPGLLRVPVLLEDGQRMVCRDCWIPVSWRGRWRHDAYWSLDPAVHAVHDVRVAAYPRTYYKERRNV